MLGLVVCVEQPNLVRSAICNQQHFLGHSPQNLIGQPLSILEGSKTDLAIQYSAIMNAAYTKKTTNFFNILYDAEGMPMPFTISCSPHCDAFENFDVCLALESSAAIELHQIVCESLTAWALVAPEWPYFISAVSDTFNREFGYSGSEWTGQTLFRIKPDHTDSNAWQLLLGQAACGKPAQDTITTKCASGTERPMLLICMPVLDADRARIAQIHLHLSPLVAYFLPSTTAPQAFPATLLNESPLVSSQRSNAIMHRGIAPRIGRPVAPAPLVINDTYIKRVQRRHRTAARRSAAAAKSAQASTPSRVGLGLLAEPPADGL